jgi:hypothetical protein
MNKASLTRIFTLLQVGILEDKVLHTYRMRVYWIKINSPEPPS